MVGIVAMRPTNASDDASQRYHVPTWPSFAHMRLLQITSSLRPSFSSLTVFRLSTASRKLVAVVTAATPRLLAAFPPMCLTRANLIDDRSILPQAYQVSIGNKRPNDVRELCFCTVYKHLNRH